MLINFIEFKYICFNGRDIMSNKKTTMTTEQKIRKSCNTLVFLWKRKYDESIKKNKPAPRPITIPQIAKHAGRAPKTVYKNKDYKAIALTAIAKTKLTVDEDLGTFVNKDYYSINEVKQIVLNCKQEFEAEKAILLKDVTIIIKERDKYQNECNVLNNTLLVQIERHAKLEFKYQQSEADKNKLQDLLREKH